MTDTILKAGVELGGTKCVCILASGPDDIRAEERIDTRGPADTLAAIAAVLARWHAEHGFVALGLASFGPVELDERSADYGRIVNTPKPGWNGADVVALGTPFAVPVGFDTDVNAAALAEGRWGGAQGLRSFAYVTVGTGIGVGSIVGGHPVRGLGHSEAGHMRVARMAGADWPGACLYHGACVEGLAAGPAIAAHAGRPAAELAPDDPAWDEVVHALAGLFHNLVLTICPERILVGGGIAIGQGHLLPRLREALIDSLAGYGAAPAIARNIGEFLARPMLGPQAGPLGAIALAQAAFDRDNAG
jgi:fructokinase